MTEKNRVLSIVDMLESKLETSEVMVPEWGGKILIRELTAKERMTMTKKMTSNGKVDFAKLDIFAPFLLVHGIVDADGQNIVSNKDAEALTRKSSKIVDRIAKAVAALSGMSNEAAGEKLGN